MLVKIDLSTSPTKHIKIQTILRQGFKGKPPALNTLNMLPNFTDFFFSFFFNKILFHLQIDPVEFKEFFRWKEIKKTSITENPIHSFVSFKVTVFYIC